MQPKRLIKSLSVILLALIAGMANAGSIALKDVSFATLPGGRFEVRMDFDGAPPEPAGYEIDKPARLVFDFAGIQNALTTKKFALPFQNAQSAVVLGGEDRTRLILNMTTLDRYQTRIDGNSFFIEVGSNKMKDPLVSTTGLAEKLSSDINRFESGITNIDFQRGENGEGKVLVTLSDAAASINVEQSANEIKLNFLDTQLPTNLRRRLDVTDFATPVLSVSSAFDGKDTVISIKPQGNQSDYDYLAYQTDNLYVVSVKRLTAQEQEEKKSKFTYVGEKLSLNFQDIPVRSVLQIIADFTELNLVASDTVEGTITLRLDNVPWDQALDLVLKTKGLDKRQIGSVLMVAPASEIAEQERRQLETKKQLQELAPLHTENLQILYADAKTIFALFEGTSSTAGGSGTDEKKGILSSRGTAIVDERTNAIIVTDTDDKIAEFRALVKQLDIPIKQVSIEARLVRASTNYAKSLGVRWGIDGQQCLSSSCKTEARVNGGMGNSLNGFLNTTDSQWIGGTTTNYGGADTVALAANNPTSQFSLGILDKSSGTYVAMELSAMESSGNGEVVSQPKVITQDKTEASIKSGTQIPYSTVSKDGSTSTTFKDAVLSLSVTPSITPDDHIMMKVKVNKDSRGDQVPGVGPAINVTEIITNVMVANGETAVIGGIFEEETTQSVEKVPFLGDLPFVGRLFRRNSNGSNKTELLIFLTPRIVSNPLARN